MAAYEVERECDFVSGGLTPIVSLVVTKRRQVNLNELAAERDVHMRRSAIAREDSHIVAIFRHDRGHAQL